MTDTSSTGSRPSAHGTSRAIEVRDLRKRYGSHPAVDGLTFHVDTGEVVALLGPNGAGKTTTVEILEGHRQRDTGEVTVLGHDPGRGDRALRERIGIVLQDAGIEEVFSVREILEMTRGLYPRRRDIDEVLELVGLTEKADARVKTLSGGQQRRVDLALGLIGDPDLIFLDEPTTGFDPAARRQAWEVVEGLRSLGRTILLTTHYMDEAERLADRIIVIAGGRLLAEGTSEDLRAQSGLSPWLRFRLPAGSPALPDGLASRLVSAEVDATGSRLPGSRSADMQSEDPVADVHALTGWAVAEGVSLTDLSIQQPTLEDVYLALVEDGAGDLGAPEDEGAEG